MDTMNASSPLRILLVEDNEHDRLAFRRAFQKSDLKWQITECVRAEEALEKLRTDSASFDVVVVDHALPGMRGLELCKELLNKGIPLPLILLTGKGSEQLAVAALKAGVHDYIIKDPSDRYLDLLPVVLPEVVRQHGDRLAREQAEEALRESERRFRNIVEGTQAGYFFVDLDGRFRDVNDAWLRMHGYASRDEIIGKHFSVTHLEEDKEHAHNHFEDMFTGKPIPSGECTRVCKDGSIACHTFSANPVTKRGKIVGVEAFVIDITKRKRAEDELRKINEELNNFSHIVSHDLKTPIAFIQGFSSQLLESCAEKLGGKERTCLERIKANANRMELLISDLLALSRLGRVVANFEHVSSLEIVNNVVSGIQDRLKAGGVELVVANDLPTIWCDAARLHQVFENLLVNAIKFRDRSRKAKIEVECEDKEDVHQFCVRDNGIGIDPKHHQKIFERFYRLKETEDEEGTGLGLGIVERIINNHGGRVWVESERGKGSAFYLTIPCKQ